MVTICGGWGNWVNRVCLKQGILSPKWQPTRNQTKLMPPQLFQSTIFTAQMVCFTKIVTTLHSLLPLQPPMLGTFYLREWKAWIALSYVDNHLSAKTNTNIQQNRNPLLRVYYMTLLGVPHSKGHLAWVPPRSSSLHIWCCFLSESGWKHMQSSTRQINCQLIHAIPFHT